MTKDTTTRQRIRPCMMNITYNNKPTAAGFEPARAEPSGFLVHLLNHSDKPPDVQLITQGLISCTWRLLTGTPIIPIPHIGSNSITIISIINTAESDCLRHIIETEFVKGNPVLIESLSCSGVFVSICLSH